MPFRHGSTKEMEMIRHGNISADLPTVPLLCIRKFSGDNLKDIMDIQQFSTKCRAGGYKKYRVLSKDSIQTLQMIVIHSKFQKSNLRQRSLLTFTHVHTLPAQTDYPYTRCRRGF